MHKFIFIYMVFFFLSSFACTQFKINYIVNTNTLQIIYTNSYTLVYWYKSTCKPFGITEKKKKLYDMT